MGFHKRCKGCFAGCNIPAKNKDGSCPCGVCILKMICTGEKDTVCDEWEFWFDSEYKPD